MPCASSRLTLPSVPADDTVRQPWTPPPFSARKRLPPSVPLVGDGQSVATGKFRSRRPEQSKRVAGYRDRTLSRSCPTQKSKNFVSRARSRTAQRSGFSPWKRSFCSSGSDRSGTVSCRGHWHLALIVRGVANETCRWQGSGHRLQAARSVADASRPRRAEATKAGARMVRWNRWKGQTKLAQGAVRLGRWKG